MFIKSTILRVASEVVTDLVKPDKEAWLALVVGNSRLHWAYFLGEELQATWNLPHLSEQAIATLVASQFDFTPYGALSVPLSPVPSSIAPTAPLWFASVVPSQTQHWQTHCPMHVITLDHIPLKHLYATLGIDRALTLLGAGQHWGFPVLVIDAGTALTVTGADKGQHLIGGAILPGLGLQLRSLSNDTAALPHVGLTDELALPERWATNTPDAIRSGVIYSLLAGLRDFIQQWQHDFPDSAIVFTGGDSLFLSKQMKLLCPSLGNGIYVEPDLIFLGIPVIKRLFRE